MCPPQLPASSAAIFVIMYASCCAPSTFSDNHAISEMQHAASGTRVITWHLQRLGLEAVDSRHVCRRERHQNSTTL